MIRKIRKALAAAVTGAAGAAGIVLADLPWPSIIGAAILGFAGVWISPANAPTKAQLRQQQRGRRIDI